MNDVNESAKSAKHSEMKGYMELQLNDPTNHRIYSWVNEEYFYKGLERAKVEKLFVNDVGRVDLYKLVQFLWGAWADGRVIALPNHECRKSVTEYISKITSCDDGKVEAAAEKIIDAKPKRKSRAKSKVEIDTNNSEEQNQGNI
jgi:hypothetical protein